MRSRILLREAFFQGSSTVCRALCSEHTHMRELLIAKDYRPCGAGSRFPRAPITSDDQTMQSVTRWEGRGRMSFPETNRGGYIYISLLIIGRIRTAIFKKCQYVVQPRGCRLKSLERKPGTDNIPAANQPPGHWLKNKETPLMFPVVLMKN